MLKHDMFQRYVSKTSLVHGSDGDYHGQQNPRGQQNKFDSKPYTIHHKGKKSFYILIYFLAPSIHHKGKKSLKLFCLKIIVASLQKSHRRIWIHS